MVWNICFVKNIDSVTGTYCGMEIQPDAYYQSLSKPVFAIGGTVVGT